MGVDEKLSNLKYIWLAIIISTRIVPVYNYDCTTI